MSLTYKDVVYRGHNGQYDLIWCEYRARFHTISELRYEVRAFEASLEFIPEPIYRKGKSIVDSHWKNTPQKARQDIEDEVGELKRDNIVYEKSFSVTFTIIDEEF
ncbi:hypothetical protein BK124_18990 [Paenibacillus amylolyticus]|uniref:hypothetical protein n=1 Tax=Paenibacillus amylolyticus TaxID=1451 RepID=UPI00096ECC1E|nr:hypothetical protein [Paenibacillus amylolyticus]OME95790.1 hypothetical protein BK124_18990 [Paenibacillus amylolyticus]